MSLTGTEDLFNYTETEDLKILELEYKGSDLSMMILLPKEESLTDLSKIISSLNRDSYKEWLDEMTQKEVDLYLPKFKFETKYSLEEYLIDMGMIDAFSGINADFSGMNEKEDLFISKVLHKAFVEVNEEGTEAAAATAVVMFTTSADPNNTPKRIVVDCDQPFLFTIHHKETGTILFIGEVNNLEESE